jgi:ubiquinone/menaquinone biosynthesis C-methylase UbiE
MWGTAPNRWVEQELAGLPPGRAVDVAAGEGRNAIWLAARGWRVTAVDFSAVALERGRRLAAAQPGEVAGRVTWQNADVTRWEAPGPVFDLVLLAYLQLPAAQRRGVLRQAAAALAPGGTLLVVGHDTSNLTAGVGGPQDERVLFTPEDVLDDLGGTELVTTLAEQVRRPVQVEGGSEPRYAIDALVRCFRPVAARQK